MSKSAILWSILSDTSSIFPSSDVLKMRTSIGTTLRETEALKDFTKEIYSNSPWMIFYPSMILHEISDFWIKSDYSYLLCLKNLMHSFASFYNLSSILLVDLFTHLQCTLHRQCLSKIEACYTLAI